MFYIQNKRYLKSGRIIFSGIGSFHTRVPDDECMIRYGIGHYSPDGVWHEFVERETEMAAKNMCRYLNGAPIHEPSGDDYA